jgi:hypothetical protein
LRPGEASVHELRGAIPWNDLPQDTPTNVTVAVRFTAVDPDGEIRARVLPLVRWTVDHALTRNASKAEASSKALFRVIH